MVTVETFDAEPEPDEQARQFLRVQEGPGGEEVVYSDDRAKEQDGQQPDPDDEPDWEEAELTAPDTSLTDPVIADLEDDEEGPA